MSSEQKMFCSVAATQHHSALLEQQCSPENYVHLIFCKAKALIVSVLERLVRLHLAEAHE